MTQRPTAAVIGSGVSGLTAAYVLSRTHEVTLFETDTRLGGHADTHRIATQRGELGIDTGFIVHNDRTYPQLTRLFGELGITTRDTEMSMSISCDGCGLAYAGGRGVRGILAQPRRVVDPRFVRLLTEVPRFHRLARALLTGGGRTGAQDGDAPPADITLGDFLRQARFSPYFLAHFAIPLVACVWSCGVEDADAYPAAHLFTFLDHHGMLQVRGSPTWRTLVGGSAQYVERVTQRLGDVRTSSPVTSVQRHSDGVDVRCGGVVERFDQAVLATHADDALTLLADATVQEKTALGAIGYSTNTVVLHRDSRLLPGPREARASWNYRMPECSATLPKVRVSYWSNRLQGLIGDEDYLVTLNDDGTIPTDLVVAQRTYTHPVFTTEAVAAAAWLRANHTPRLAFAGAHLGWGFHEDGCRSGVAAARALGTVW